MLHLGLIGGAKAPLVGQRLRELGAVVATGQQPWPAIDESVTLLHDVSEDVVGQRPCLHLVLGVAQSGPMGAAACADRSGRTPAPAAVPANRADVWLNGSTAPEGLTAAVTELWHERIVPFEANLRASKRAPRNMRPVLMASDPTWPLDAARLVGRLQEVVGHLALRIDHIGSTSVRGLPAKDLIDLQVTVADLEVAHGAAEAARGAGFVHVRGEWSGRDRLGVEHPEEIVVDGDPGRPTNVNVRAVTAPVWRDALLFRDWLRAHPGERDAYAAMKQGLAERPRAHVDEYGAAKAPWISAAIDRAEDWAVTVQWNPQP